MATPLDIPAWIALFIGLYALAAAVGEFRRPGHWLNMVQDLERNAGLSFVTGLLCIALGAAIYLTNPWRPDDWLSITVSALGGLIVAEGLLMLAAGDRILAFATRLLGRARTLWAGLSALIGFALIIAAMARL